MDHKCSRPVLHVYHAWGRALALMPRRSKFHWLAREYLLYVPVLCFDDGKLPPNDPALFGGVPATFSTGLDSVIDEQGEGDIAAICMV